MKRSLRITVPAATLVFLVASAMPALAAPKRSTPGHARRASAPAARPSSDASEERVGTASRPAVRGNAGSIKAARPTSDFAPNNEPHLGCALRLDFYGFRTGTLAVTIEAHAPTGSGMLKTDSVTIGSDARGSTYQTSRTYDLSTALRPYTPHPKQGYHVKISAKRIGTNGRGAKHKVVWVRRCAETGGTGGTTPTGIRRPRPDRTTEVRGISRTRPSRTARVLGASLRATAVTIGPEVAPRNLALTGWSFAGLLRWALLFLLSGAAAVGLSKRLPRRATT